MKDLLVVIPRIKETGVYETDFSFMFCRKHLNKSLKDFSHEMLEYESLETCLSTDFLAKIKNFSYILFLKRPDILISSFTVRALIESPFHDKVLVPIYNESGNKKQLVNLDFLYHDIPTFHEFCSYIYQKNQSRFKETLQADKDLFLCKTKIFPKALTTNSALISLGAYAHKFEKYYDAPRNDLIELFPKTIEKILDIGCAKGGLGKKIKEMNNHLKIFGVEMNPQLAKEASKHYEKVWIGKFEEVEIKGSFDAVVIGDVLEHIYDPWSFLRKVHKLLRNNGYLIGSVPNASHWTIVKALMKGDFEYVPVGLLCVSHIRFFTYQSLIEILKESGFEIEILKEIKDTPSPKGREFISTTKTFLKASEKLEVVELLFRCKKLAKKV